MDKLLVVLACLGIAAALPARDVFQRRNQGRIIGGEFGSIRDLPYQTCCQKVIDLAWNGPHDCGGCIISEEWVLTAAHCLYAPMEDIAIRTGSDLTSSGGIVHEVDRIIIHEGFSRGSEEGSVVLDIGLVRVKKPFVFDEGTQPIPLFNEGEKSEPGAYSVISGWGYNGKGYDDRLRTAIVPIVSKEECAVALKAHGILAKGQICAGVPEGGLDTCGGDSGGPLTIDGRLAGIVSWGIGCGQENLPGIYTEVAFYRRWILDNSGV